MEVGDIMQDLIQEQQFHYRFKGATGSFTGYASNSTGVQALAYGLSLAGQFIISQFSTSSRSNSIETAGDEMVDAGVIFVTCCWK